ncbi:MAG: TatD family hydrolase [Crocinitomicaceae bacterium]|nr:TatD family hydrolase [Crocinitomicaceae bacterium]
MHFIDTHAHTYDEAFLGDLDTTISNAKEAGISKILMPNIDVESIEPMFAIQENYPFCIPMMGLHPAYVKADWEEQLEKIESYLFADPLRFCAIGEIGMDLYWDKSFMEEQKTAFIRQIQWAKNLDLPIAIHARDAFTEIFEILDQENDASLKGVFHCFTGNTAQAKHIKNYGGFLLGIGGVLTYKNSELGETLKQAVSLEDLVLETDAPYLPPVPYRGKRNESAYMLEVAYKLVDLYQVPLEEVARISSHNAEELFQLNRF